MKMLELSEAIASLADFVKNIRQEPVIVTANGKPVAALISLENVDQETLSLSLNPQFQALITRSRTRQREEGGISSNKMRKKLGLK